MIKLKKLLSDDTKILRHRRLVLNIQITILTWLFELGLSIFVIVVKLTVVDGMENKFLDFLVRELIWFVFTIFLPALLLINDTELKDNILLSDWYICTLDKLGLTYKGPMRADAPTNENSPAEADALGEDEVHEDQRNITNRDDAEDINEARMIPQSETE